MLEPSETELRKEFQNLLLELSDPATNLQEKEVQRQYFERFETLYSTVCYGRPFQHYYSDIFQILQSIQVEPNSQYNMETLGHNIEFLKNEYQPLDKRWDITHNLRKLTDHINLDMARMQYADGGDSKLLQEDNIKHLLEQQKTLQEEIKKAQLEAAEAKRKIESSQKEYVAILGIFSSVVLAFMGGIGFSSAVLSAINQASIYRLLLIVDILAFVLLNTICYLMNFIFQIVKEEKLGFWSYHKKICIGCILVAILIFAGWAIDLQSLQGAIPSIKEMI